MKKLMLAMIVMFSTQVMAIEPVTALFSAFANFAPVAAGVYAGANSEITNACYNEKVRTVAWKNNPNGYSFDVAGCDYQAKKDVLVLK